MPRSTPEEIEQMRRLIRAGRRTGQRIRDRFSQPKGAGLDAQAPEAATAPHSEATPKAKPDGTS